MAARKFFPSSVRLYVVDGSIRRTQERCSLLPVEFRKNICRRLPPYLLDAALRVILRDLRGVELERDMI